MLVDTMLHQIFMAFLVPGVSENRELKKFVTKGQIIDRANC